VSIGAVEEFMLDKAYGTTYYNVRHAYVGIETWTKIRLDAGPKNIYFLQYTFTISLIYVMTRAAIQPGAWRLPI
jgi:hypothetical protein